MGMGAAQVGNHDFDVWIPNGDAPGHEVGDQRRVFHRCTGCVSQAIVVEQGPRRANIALYALGVQWAWTSTIMVGQLRRWVRG
jgi:hypothetical protein